MNTAYLAPKKPKPKVRITKPSAPRRRETLITDLAPIFALKFFQGGAVVAMRRIGRRWSEYFVDPMAIRQALAATPVSSGLLDPHTLATGTRAGQSLIVTLIPPRKVKVGTKGGQREREWTFTTPPIAWCGWGANYRIYALHPKDLVRGWPKGADISLYHAPFANTYQSGNICWGSGRRPGEAKAGEMVANFLRYAEDSFFIEHATSSPSREFAGDVIRLYASLRGRRTYPCDDLKPQGKLLSHALSGEVFDATQ